MHHRQSLPTSQLYDTRYKTVEVSFCCFFNFTSYNVHLEGMLQQIAGRPLHYRKRGEAKRKKIVERRREGETEDL